MIVIATSATINTTIASVTASAEKARIVIMLINDNRAITARIRVDLFTMKVFKE
jgi:hypothetical protein